MVPELLFIVDEIRPGAGARIDEYSTLTIVDLALLIRSSLGIIRADSVLRQENSQTCIHS